MKALPASLSLVDRHRGSVAKCIPTKQQHAGLGLIIKEIVADHADEAPFLWSLRADAVSAPHYDLDDLAQLDNRVDAHLDGLRVAGDFGWDMAAAQLELLEPGAVFATGVLALESKDSDRLARVIATAEAAPETVAGLVSALGWVGPANLAGTGKMLLDGETPFLRRLGIAACAVHRVDPGAALDRALEDPANDLRARAAKAAGELGRTDLRERLEGWVDAPDEADDAANRFWTAWSAVLLGGRGAAVDRLRLLATAESDFAARAVALAPRVMEPAAVKTWLKALAGDPAQLRTVIAAIGACGDPHYVPWLVKQMAVPEVTRIAGEAFAMITGVDIATEEMDGDAPEEAEPTGDEEDEEIPVDPDEDLPWAAQAPIQAWWAANGARFEPGIRYLCGQKIAAEHCHHVLATGYQRQRAAAALELALMDPETPLFETRAPGARQQGLLGV